MTSPLENLAGPGKPLRREPAEASENRGEYEGDLALDERLVADLISACRAVADALAKLPALA